MPVVIMTTELETERFPVCKLSVYIGLCKSLIEKAEKLGPFYICKGEDVAPHKAVIDIPGARPGEDFVSVILVVTSGRQGSLTKRRFD